MLNYNMDRPFWFLTQRNSLRNHIRPSQTHEYARGTFAILRLIKCILEIIATIYCGTIFLDAQFAFTYTLRYLE